MKVAISDSRSPAPGDIRLLGAGDTVYLKRSCKMRGDWGSLLPALTIAVHRGASVIWEEE